MWGIEPLGLSWGASGGEDDLLGATGVLKPAKASLAASARAGFSVDAAPLSFPTTPQRQCSARSLAGCGGCGKMVREPSTEADRRALDRRLIRAERELRLLSSRLNEDGEPDGSWRESRIELRGAFDGLLEEHRALSKRVEGLDERLCTRAASLEEAARQSFRELQQSLQDQDRRGRLAAAAAEDAQRRGAARLRRAEVSLESAEWRLARLEEELAAGARQPPVEPAQAAQDEAPTAALQEAVHELSARVEALECVSAETGRCLDGLSPREAEFEDAQLAKELSVQERRLATFEERVRTQLEEVRTALGAVRVKVDSQLQRHEAIAEWIQSTHFPGFDALRKEVSEQRARDEQKHEAAVAALRRSVDLAMESTCADVVAEKVDSLALRLAAYDKVLASLRRDTHNLRVVLRAVLGLPEADCRAAGGIPTTRGMAEAPGQEQLCAVVDQLEWLAGRVAELEFDRSGSDATGMLPPTHISAGVAGAQIGLLAGASVGQPTRGVVASASPHRVAERGAFGGAAPKAVEEASRAKHAAKRPGSLAAAALAVDASCGGGGGASRSPGGSVGSGEISCGPEESARASSGDGWG